MYINEILLTKNEITADEWRQLVLVFAKHLKGLRPFTLAVIFQENLVRYFVLSKKDISQLSSGIEGIMILPLNETEQSIMQQPSTTERIRFLKIPPGGNLLDLKERYKVQNGLDLSSVFLDIQRLGERLAAKLHVYFNLGNVVKATHQQLGLFPAHLLNINYGTHTNYLLKTPPKYLSLEKTLHLLTAENINAIFSVGAYPYFSNDYYLNLTSYEFDKHSLIVGASGSGKSKLISLYIDRLYRTALKMNYRVIVIDPHASIAEDLAYIQESKVINFKNESTELFAGGTTDISAATELTSTLFKSLLAEQYNSKLERALRFSLFVLFTAQNMSLDNLKRFITDLDLRTQILDHVNGYVPQNIIKFFGADFNEIRTSSYNEAILPIVALVDEMQMQPALVKGGDVSLAKTIQDNFVTVFSLNKVSMGEKTVKTIAGLLIQQIFLLAQARVLGQKVILIIDEVSVVQNPALASILAEARKFNLSVVLTQQYFGQVEKGLRDAIFANVLNYYIFKVSEEDARALEGNLNIELPKEIAEQEHQKGLKESDVRVKLLTELHPRECILRIAANGQLNPCIKARTVEAHIPVQSVMMDSAKLSPYAKEQNLPAKFVEGSVKAIQPSLQSAMVKAVENAPPTRSFNLSELLAEHSSSRLKVNKKEQV